METVHDDAGRGMIRVVVTGSECTGKTTLARALAEHYGAPWVPEYVREFVDGKGSAPEAGDLSRIGSGVLSAEDAVAGAASGLLILDTDLLSTIVYGTHYFGSVPETFDDELRRRRADLYLLCDIDVPWIADPGQRDRGDRRDEVQRHFRNALQARDLPYLAMRGDADTRLTFAIDGIDRLLQRNVP